MKHFKRFFILVLCVLPWVAGANVATTAGSNLTAWNGNGGSANNNTWNTMMNSRSQTGSTAKADFGNCNSLILRCAQPKCAACTTMELAKPVVAGCVNSSKDCKKHGDDLIEFIAAQIVASAAEKLQAQELAIKQAEAQAAANNQSSQQIANMQQQMAQMQRDMQAQNAQQMAQMQAALDEQKALAAQAQQQAAAAATQQAQAAAAAAATAPGVTVAQQVAIDNGVSEDTLVRQQISGEILSAVEDAKAQLKELKETMDQAFRYAGCDARGNNCSGPKRVKIFKEKALKFFEPYDTIADEMEDALETALALGVDISDVIMMLNGACNKWGKYACAATDKCSGTDCTGNVHNPATYEEGNTCKNGKSVAAGNVRGGYECRDGQIVPPYDDIRCSLIGMVSDSEDNSVESAWMDESYDGDKFIRVGCATTGLESISMFGGRKKKKNKTLDLDTLERIILQDAPEYAAVGNKFVESSSDAAAFKYCGLTSKGYTRLRDAVSQKKLPDSDICVGESKLNRVGKTDLVKQEIVDYTVCAKNANTGSEEECKRLVNNKFNKIVFWKDDRCMIESEEYCFVSGGILVEKSFYEDCTNAGGTVEEENDCQCDHDRTKKYNSKTKKCE